MVGGKVAEPGDVKIEVAIVVVVDERQTERESIGVNPGGVGHIFECPIAFVVIKHDATVRAQGEIRAAVVVVVADGASCSLAMKVEVRLSGHLDESPSAGVSIQSGMAAFTGVH